MKPLFSIVPFEFIVEEVKEPLFIFDLPTNLVVSLDDIEIPSHIFDYFNPLIVDPVALAANSSGSPRYGKLLFYHQGESEPVRRFSCHRLVLERSDIFLAVLESTIHYPPNFDIDYRTLTVSRTLRMRQLCDLFEKIQAVPLPQPLYRGLPMPSPLSQLFGAMFRSAAPTNQVPSSPPSPSPALFLNPEDETIMVFQADDSDQDEDYGEEESVDDLD